jgi:hypothetical protein
MSFNTQENFDYAQNPALSIGAGKIPIDASSVSEVTYEYLTNTAAVVNGVGEPMSYNGQETIFDVRVPATSRIDFTKSYFRVMGVAANMAVGINSPVITGANQGVSIPWNTIAAIFDTAEIQMNQSATLTEQITQNLGDGSMVKMLTTYTREALEAASDEFFTPTIEDVRDTINGLSANSIARAVENLVYNAGGTYVPRVHTKNIPIADIFESTRIPAGFYLQNLQFKLRPKAVNNILTVAPALMVPGAVNKYFVTDIRLYLTMSTLTQEQLKIEAGRIRENASIIREAFYTYDAIQKTHSQSASYRDSNIKNMQAAVFLIPSSTATDALGVNRYQYCYGLGPAPAIQPGISSYQQRYENIYSPSTPLSVNSTITGYSTNTNLYAQYRLLCRRMTGRELSPALRFNTAMGYITNGFATDDNPYVLFCSQFYPLTSFAHKVMAGSDHEIITQGGNVEPLVIVRIRMSFLEIRGDTSVYIIN